MFRTYYMLAKPGIIYGNILTAIGGFLLASKGHVQWPLLLATLAGTALTIASGCVFNNYIDRGIDKKMARTKKRALVSGAIPAQNALLYGAVLGIGGLLILKLWTNSLVFLIGIVSLVFYVVLYGIAKRNSIHGTLVGTVPGAASVVAGYAAVSQQLDLGALLLFLILVTWQMPHFYAIALRRLKDYKAAGIPVWPALKGAENTKRQIQAYIALFIAANALLGIFGYAGPAFMIVMILLGARWLWMTKAGFASGVDDTAWARKMFLFSLVVICALSAMLSLNSLLSVEVVYNLGMLVLIHVVIALGSIAYSTHLFISPAKTKFNLAYALVALTLASGTYLAVASHAQMVQACTTGLLYTGFISLLIFSARKKLASI